MAGFSCVLSNEARAYIRGISSVISHRGNEVFVLDKHKISIAVNTSDTNYQFCDFDGCTVFFDGVLYNLSSIRQRESKLDAGVEEIIAHLYKKYGYKFVKLFDGDFLIVIFDDKEKAVYAFRDCIGSIPVYLYKSKGQLALVNEIKQLTALPDWRPKGNKNRLFDYLQFEIIDFSNETMFADVYQPMAGQYIKIDIESGNFSFLTWNTWNAHITKEKFQKAKEQYLCLLRNSINKRRSKCNAALLSGGLDSSSIVSLLASDSLENESDVYTLTFEGNKVDESAYAEYVVKKHGITKWTKLTFSFEDVKNEIDKIVWLMDEPFASMSVLSHYFTASRIGRKDDMVLFDGQGADELLAGYIPYFQNVSLVEKAKTNKSLSLCRAKRVIKKKYGRTILPTDYLPLSGDLTFQINSYLLFSNTDMLNNPLKQKAASISTAIRNELIYSLPELMHYQDRICRGFGLSVRNPFLDKDLISFSLQLDSDYIIKNGVTKHILREAMAGLLPKEIKSRYTKYGFIVPEEDWVRQNSEWIKGSIKKALVCLRGLVDCTKIESRLNEQMKEGSFEFSFWKFISLGKWCEVFSIKEFI